MILWACGDSAIVAPSCGTPFWSWHHGFVSKLAIGTIPSWHHLVPFHRAADLRCQLLFCGHFALGSDTLWHQFLNWLSCLSSKFNKIRKNMTEWIITTPWVLTFEISAGQMIDWNRFEWRAIGQEKLPYQRESGQTAFLHWFANIFQLAHFSM